MCIINKEKYKALATLILIVCSLAIHAQTSKYDKALADSLGADDYGMKMYVLVILKSGPVKIDDKAKNDSLFRGHMQNIGRLAGLGKLTVAGPLESNEKGYRGIFILNVKTTEEAKSLLETDPAIHAKVLDIELYGWYGSAALPMYIPPSEKIRKKSF
jgi:uncharacterized protein YciI